MANARYDAPDADAFQPFAISRHRRVSRRRHQAESEGAGVSVEVDGASAPGSDVTARVSAARRCRRRSGVGQAVSSEAVKAAKGCPGGGGAGGLVPRTPALPSPLAPLSSPLTERWQTHGMTPLALAYSSHLPSLGVDRWPGVDPRPSPKVRVSVGVDGASAPGSDVTARVSAARRCRRRSGVGQALSSEAVKAAKGCPGGEEVPAA